MRVQKLRMHLVLALSGNEEVIEYILQVIKGGSVLRFVIPALHHDVIELPWAAIWTRHPVVPVKVTDHLRIRHA